jgi:hypothetical protein
MGINTLAAYWMSYFFNFQSEGSGISAFQGPGGGRRRGRIGGIYHEQLAVCARDKDKDTKDLPLIYGEKETHSLPFHVLR